jgi:hypothetical protein
MSEEKKDIGSTDSQSKATNTTEAGRDKAAMSEGSSTKVAGKGARPRNHDVLPGILGKQLKAAYSELLNAPVPDAITDLIKQLKDKEPSPAPEANAGAKGPRGEENGR